MLTLMQLIRCRSKVFNYQFNTFTGVLMGMAPEDMIDRFGLIVYSLSLTHTLSLFILDV